MNKKLGIRQLHDALDHGPPLADDGPHPPLGDVNGLANCAVGKDATRRGVKRLLQLDLVLFRVGGWGFGVRGFEFKVKGFGCRV